MKGRFQRGSPYGVDSAELYCSRMKLQGQSRICDRKAERFRTVVRSSAPSRALLVDFSGTGLSRSVLLNSVYKTLLSVVSSPELALSRSSATDPEAAVACFCRNSLGQVLGDELAQPQPFMQLSNEHLRLRRPEASELQFKMEMRTKVNGFLRKVGSFK